jgi:hypothetical protein
MSDRKHVAKLVSLPVLALCGFLIAATMAGVGLGTVVTTTTVEEFDGCTPGFWKNLEQHGDEWTGLSPTDTLEDVFDVPDGLGIDDVTLIQALGPPADDALNGDGPNGAYQLLRHAIAGILNANHPDVDYPFSAAEIIALTNAALLTGDKDTINAQKDEFADANEAGCPL